MPWKARLARSRGKVGDRPQNSDPNVKTAIPQIRTFFMAPLSQILPKTRISPAIIRK